MKSTAFLVRLSPEEKQAIDQAAEAEGVPLSVWVRQAIRKALNGSVIGVPVSIREIREQAEQGGPPAAPAGKVPPLCPKCQRKGVPTCNACRKARGLRVYFPEEAT